MTHTTLAGWEQNIAIRLVTAIPTLLVTDGIPIADAYLSSTGGWLPDNLGAPTDLGVPASGLTDDQIVALLIAQIGQSQYEFTATLLVPISLSVYASLSPGLDSAQLRDALSTNVRSYLNRIAAKLPVGLDSSALNYTNIGSSVIGSTTAVQRALYDANIGNDPIPILSNILTLSRQRFFLDPVWNISAIYTGPTGKMMAVLVKYMDGTFQVLDGTETRRAVVESDPDTGRVLTGILN